MRVQLLTGSELMDMIEGGEQVELEPVGDIMERVLEELSPPGQRDMGYLLARAESGNVERILVLETELEELRQERARLVDTNNELRGEILELEEKLK